MMKIQQHPYIKRALREEIREMMLRCTMAEGDNIPLAHHQKDGDLKKLRDNSPGHTASTAHHQRSFK
jgi:hypothetical protein